jgi:hypothetical protein
MAPFVNQPRAYPVPAPRAEEGSAAGLKTRPVMWNNQVVGVGDIFAVDVRRAIKEHGLV